MTGSKQLEYLKYSLISQRSKLRRLDPSIISDRAMNNLGKLFALPDQLITYYKSQILTIVRFLDRLIEYLSDLQLRFENFSMTFSYERDIMNHAFRSWVDIHTSILAPTPGFVEISLPSLLFPWIHSLRFLNIFLLSPYMPQPQLYSVQVKAELRFQRDKFIDTTKIAIGNIDSTLLTLNDLNSSSLFGQLAGTADDITAYQQSLDQLVTTLRKGERWGLVKRAIIGDSSELKKLQEFSGLGNRIRTHLYAVKESVQVGEDDTNALKAGLRLFRKSIDYAPEFDFSPTGFITIPPSVSVQRGSLPFLMQRQNTISDNSDGSIKVKTPTSFNIYKYDLNMMNDTNVLARREALVHLCEDRTNYNMISGYLYTACNILLQAKLMSNLDDDLLSGVRRSWVVQQLEEIRRYDEMMGVDFASIRHDLAYTPYIHKRGGRIPYFFL